MSKKIIISIIIGAVILAAGVGTYLIVKKSPPPQDQQEKSQPSNGQGAEFVALGSSLSRASNLSSEMQGENNDYNFSTGSKIPSIFEFLKEKEKNLGAVNLASPGANMQDILDRQLPEALQLNPKYITIDPAADIVGRNSVSEYKSNLIQILDQLGSEPVVMIFTYPNFVKMRTASFASCQQNKTGVSLQNLSESNIAAFNQAIKQVVKNRNNVILLDIYNLFGSTDISDYDCLHFNQEAQKKLADEFIKILNEKKASQSPSSAPQNETLAGPDQPSDKTEQIVSPVWQYGGLAIAGKYADAEVISLGGQYRIYYAAEPETAGFKGQLYSAISSDGKNWNQEAGTRMEWATFPSVIKLSDGRFRMYYQNAGVIKSAVSSDGLSWTEESGVRIDTVNSAGLALTNVAAPTVVKIVNMYIMVYRGTINEKYTAAGMVPNNDTQLFLWAVSSDGLNFEKKGIALESRNSEFKGLLDGPEFAEWDDGSVRLYFWSYRGAYHTEFKNNSFSQTAQFDYTTQIEVPFPQNPPCDPTLAKINGTWFMYYGQHAQGIYYAILK